MPPIHETRARVGEDQNAFVFLVISCHWIDLWTVLVRGLDLDDAVVLEGDGYLELASLGYQVLYLKFGLKLPPVVDAQREPRHVDRVQDAALAGVVLAYEGVNGTAIANRDVV